MPGEAIRDNAMPAARARADSNARQKAADSRVRHIVADSRRRPKAGSRAGPTTLSPTPITAGRRPSTPIADATAWHRRMAAGEAVSSAGAVAADAA
jgi:hypothetical protein